MAHEIATRATCDRKHVGCLLVRDNHILATGYNGSISGMDHCDDVGHIITNDRCLRTIHAEQNAICQAGKYGTSIQNTTAYITCEPCWTCFKLLLTCGIVRIVYDEFYKSEEQAIKDEKKNILYRLGVKYEKYKKQQWHE